MSKKDTATEQEARDEVHSLRESERAREDSRIPDEIDKAWRARAQERNKDPQGGRR